MAWNEPGGNGKNRDPWGGGDQGPPDLDEAFRKFREKLGAAFGGSGGGSADRGGAGLGGVPLLVGAVVAALWFYAGVNIIDEKEKAVVLRFGRFHELLQPGLNWNPALIDSVTAINVTQERQYVSQGMMLTKDENIVELPVAVQYNIADVKAFVLNVRNPEFSLQQATDSALRHVVGSSKLDQVLSDGRGQVGDEVRVKLQSYLDTYATGIQVVKVTIQEAKPPAEVKAAFDDVINAKEDEERLKNEASAYANGIVPEARGRAQRALEEAMAYQAKVVADAEGEAQRFEKVLAEYQKAPEVTRERIYLDAIQRVMSSGSKVMVNVSSGNNVLYLPLDRMGGGGASTPVPSQRPSSVSAESLPADGSYTGGRGDSGLRTRERR